MKTEEGKILAAILNVLLLTALLVTELNFWGPQHMLPFSANLRNRVLNRRWHGLESINNLRVFKERSGYQQMFQVSTGAENRKAMLHALPLIFLINAGIIYRARCEELRLSISGPRDEAVKKIFLILLLAFRLPAVTACDSGEYIHGTICCSLCPAGSVVSKHCTVLFGTNCNPCTTGEYVEHPNGLEKCFKCKACDEELGLQIKRRCTYIMNTVCKPREGYYCIENCQMARKHKTCPPGQGVKEKGTLLKDTVCEECLTGTFSSNHSSTEECKKWTICESLNLVERNKGSSEADVECVKNIQTVLAVILSLVVILILVIAGVLWWKYKGSINSSKRCSRARNDANDSDARGHLKPNV